MLMQVMGSELFFNDGVLFQAGANMIVAGTAIISAANQRAVMASLRETVESSIHKCNV